MNRLTILLLCLGLGTIAFARLYKYTLDPQRAEEILAQLAFRPRLLDEEWLKILGSRRSEVYKVERNDNLWNISRTVLKSPWLWRKMWEVNPFLANPHQIEIGQILAYYRETDQNVIRIPIIKLSRPGRDNITDLGKDSFANIGIKNKYRPHLTVLDPEEKVFGEITGAYVEGQMLDQHSNLYVELVGDPPKPGAQYCVVHVEKELKDSHREGDSLLGTLVRVVGTLEILGKGEVLFKARLTGVYGPIRRNDILIAPIDPIASSQLISPPDEFQTRVVMGEDFDLTNFGQGQIILLNKGAKDGMQKGFFFRVYMEMDPFTKKTTGVEPDYKGEVQVIYTGAFSSVGYIMRNWDPILVGDILLPHQLFFEPPPPPIRNAETIEIN